MTGVTTQMSGWAFTEFDFSALIDFSLPPKLFLLISTFVLQYFKLFWPACAE